MADTIKSTDVPSVHGMVVLNADGTALGAPVGGSTASNQTDGSQKTQIVDAGGEVATVTGGKLDVNAAIDTTGLATSAKQDTMIGHVDGIETLLGTIDADTGAVKTATEAIQAAQLPDGHNVTVDNASLTVDLGVNNDVTITSGTVTANAGTNLNTSALLTTSAHDGAFGTAGSADSQVRSIQGIASMTPVQVSQATGTNLHAVVDSGTITTVSTVTAVTAITNALPAGTNGIGKLTANSGVDIGDVDVTSISAGTNNIGQISIAPQTANGLSVFNATSSDGSTALTNSAQVIKATAGQLYGWYIYNPNTIAAYVQLYNTAAASVTVGTTSPLFMLTIPAGGAANVEMTNGITFSNAGWSSSATSTAGGNGAPTTALDAVFFYK